VNDHEIGQGIARETAATRSGTETEKGTETGNDHEIGTGIGSATTVVPTGDTATTTRTIDDDGTMIGVPSGIPGTKTARGGTSTVSVTASATGTGTGTEIEETMIGTDDVGIQGNL
jgi:hypothetical protein